MNVNPDRIRDLRTNHLRPLVELIDRSFTGPVVYCMNRDLRSADNWALIYAQDVAVQLQTPLHVVLCLDPTLDHGPLSAQQFLHQGLHGLSGPLLALNISFSVLYGNRATSLARYMHEQNACFLIVDFEPLRATRTWLQTVVDTTPIPIHQVDAHNIVPCWLASTKQEFGAHTLRPKITKLLPTFLEEFPELKRHAFGEAPECRDARFPNISATGYSNPASSENAAQHRMRDFLQRIEQYADRNDPTQNGQSGLSCYLHFGQISAQRIALEVASIPSKHSVVKEKFLDELIVRRELSDNYTFYNDDYDSFDGFPDWAKRTLNTHRTDARQYVYEFEDWETANTHDALWNAAQRQMMSTGKMHGYMRMYWAKKILEWSATPELAIATAIALNDAYEIDGRDPNGYAGIAWSIGGVHDRPWFERPVFGSVRYMNASGCARKFDVNTYIRTYAQTP